MARLRMLIGAALLFLVSGQPALAAAAVTQSPTSQTNEPYLASYSENASQTNGTHKCTLRPPPNPSTSLTGSVVRCPTPEDRKCFGLKKILMDGKCYTVGTPGPCRSGEIVVIDKKFYKKNRVLRGACRPIYACDNKVFKEFMTYDECCYEQNDIRKYVCPSEKNLRLRKNTFGEGECESIDQEQNSSPSEIEHEIHLQGEDCVVPDLSFSWDYDPYTLPERFPHLSVGHPLANLSLRCDDEERTCLLKGQVLAPRGAPGARADPAGCHSLLTRGPCPPGAWLVLDKSAVHDERRIFPVCDWARCAPDSVFLAKDQRCVKMWELQHQRCASEDLVFDVFGEAHCTRFTTQEELLRLPQHIKDDECQLIGEVTLVKDDDEKIAGRVAAQPPCPVSDTNRSIGNLMTHSYTLSTVVVIALLLHY